MKTLTDLSDAPLENLEQDQTAGVMSMSNLAHVALQASQFKNSASLAGVYKVVLENLTEHAAACGQNEKWINRHPVSIVFSNRFAELAGINEPSAKVLDAIEQCQEWANG